MYDKHYLLMVTSKAISFTLFFINTLLAYITYGNQ